MWAGTSRALKSLLFSMSDSLGPWCGEGIFRLKQPEHALVRFPEVSVRSHDILAFGDRDFAAGGFLDHPVAPRFQLTPLTGGQRERLPGAFHARMSRRGSLVVVWLPTLASSSRRLSSFSGARSSVQTMPCPKIVTCLGRWTLA